tara:strand:- start:143 stop:424 length:282 start_codon:yes stop_codon:yes gene_type:complete
MIKKPHQNAQNASRNSPHSSTVNTPQIPRDNTESAPKGYFNPEKVESIASNFEAVEKRMRAGRAFQLGMSVEQYERVQRQVVKDMLENARNKF